ncbi:hypothetical protein [Vibrio comitans]|uniref:Uncharacterized protein n=1 Tax=Vibrio comitans NBRC 102076 TaxID=1219078 RepID=A0A4Y3IK09_9VIBR|nr:hypothetical protein [Vibrio comitans]GEA59849.1 hypothetical protein VCO01S_10420 [Vibrio comitans NBRC 102076]
MPSFPKTSHSWTVISPRLGLKVIDKSLLEAKQTGVPHDIWNDLFPNLTLETGEKITWSALSINNEEKSIVIEVTKSGRARVNHLPISSNLNIGDTIAFYFGDGLIKIFEWQ